MSPIAHYMQAHLAGAGAGIDLFTQAAGSVRDHAVRAELRRIRDELLDERRRLRRMLDDLGSGESAVLTTATRLGGLLARLKPHLVRRTDTTDLIQLEAMRDAVAGKIAGWQALLVVVADYPSLDREELRMLIAQGEKQHRFLTEAHGEVARRVLQRAH
ncbi:hypothetical protein NODU109028_07220 [Nocardioides dubius]|uniref:DUF2383 domain-containing protein n=1 Tax=Nocardioides dubius TaxID=317019 RepID=A0ABN1TZR2_9ACTN